MLGPKAFLAAPAASLGDTSPRPTSVPTLGPGHHIGAGPGHHIGTDIGRASTDIGTDIWARLATSVPISVGARPVSVPIFGLGSHIGTGTDIGQGPTDIGTDVSSRLNIGTDIGRALTDVVMSVY
jgi:hypothetical protein